MRDILEEAFDLLGEDIVIAYAKDVSQDSTAGHKAAGQGVLDYECYLRLLQRVGFTGQLILHALAESEVNSSIAFLNEKLTAIKPSVTH